MKTAIYPGSFDPFTNGHNDILNRSLKIFDKVTIAVVKNSAKNYFFSLEERVAMINELFVGHENIECIGLDSKLTVDLADELGAKAIIRGLRAVSDFEYEFQMAQMNRQLLDDIETVFLAPDQQFSFLSSTLVREVATLGGDVSGFVSPLVLERISEKL